MITNVNLTAASEGLFTFKAKLHNSNVTPEVLEALSLRGYQITQDYSTLNLFFWPNEDTIYTLSKTREADFLGYDRHKTLALSDVIPQVNHKLEELTL